MEGNIMITDIQEVACVLDKARKTYGNKNQILVCIEELNELACVLAKYPRYDEHERALLELKDKAVDELADVMVCVDHIQHIFDIDDITLGERVFKKVARLERWIENSDSLQVTVDDRKVE